jgi:uncharacterized protein (DUF4415 family)
MAENRDDELIDDLLFNDWEDEEKDILISYENGEWESVENLEQEKRRFVECQKQAYREITFKIDIDLIEWLNSQSKEEDFHTLINKVLRAYIASLNDPLQE